MAWPSLIKANMIDQPDFPEVFIEDAIYDIMNRVIECSTSYMEWEIVFVGSGRSLLPEMTLIRRMMEQRIKIKFIYFVDREYIRDETRSSVTRTITEVLKQFPTTLNFQISHAFPPEKKWTSNARLVLAFSYAVDWASTYSNIAQFLTTNWTYVLEKCTTEKVAFVDLFLYVDKMTGKMRVSDFSDVTQPPLTLKAFQNQYGVRPIGMSWKNMWKEYVGQMINEHIRTGKLGFKWLSVGNSIPEGKRLKNVRLPDRLTQKIVSGTNIPTYELDAYFPFLNIDDVIKVNDIFYMPMYGVQDLTDENYSQYCAKHNIVTPNDARDQALELCKLCGRMKSLKRKLS